MDFLVVLPILFGTLFATGKKYDIGVCFLTLQPFLPDTRRSQWLIWAQHKPQAQSGWGPAIILLRRLFLQMVYVCHHLFFISPAAQIPAEHFISPQSWFSTCI